MTSNYFVLRKVALELNDKLRGSKFLRAYSKRPDELRIEFEGGEIVALLKPIHGALFFDASGRAKTTAKNLHRFFTQAEGEALRLVEISPTDRSITVALGVYAIEIHFFGKPNAFLCEGETVMSSFRKAGNAPKAGNAATEFEQLLGKRLRQDYEKLTEAEQVVFRQELFSEAVWMLEEDGAVSVSPVSLNSGELAPGPSYAVKLSVTSAVRAKRHELTISELSSRIDACDRKLQRGLQDLEKGVSRASNIESVNGAANAILICPLDYQKGSKWIDFEGARYKLDPSLGPHQNAEALFKKARTIRDHQKELGARRETTKALLEHIHALKLRAEAAADDEGKLKALEQEFTTLVGRDSISAPAPEHSPFREFTVHGGYKVFVGRNAKQNDELTLHFAKKTDLWLHAKDVAGSHVILQRPNTQKPVDRQSKLEAAAIAAFFSDAKNQSLAPVSCTEKKYVRKRKGDAAGAVVVEREEVFLVTPKMPFTQPAF